MSDPLPHRHCTVTPEALDALLRCIPTGDVTAISGRLCTKDCKSNVDGEVLVYDDADMDGLPAIIFDLDGTLALHTNRGPYDVMRCDTDEVNPPVLAVLRAFRDLGHPILFVSGRDDVAYEKTSDWLHEHTGLNGPLFMRKTGDKRPDNQVKSEIYRTHIEPSYDVLFVLDDRQKVVDEWRRLGLSCFQVDDGQFDGVYVLSHLEWDNQTPIGVFTTKDDALAFMQEHDLQRNLYEIVKVPYGKAKLP